MFIDFPLPCLIARGYLNMTQKRTAQQRRSGVSSLRPSGSWWTNGCSSAKDIPDVHRLRGTPPCAAGYRAQNNGHRMWLSWLVFMWLSDMLSNWHSPKRLMWLLGYWPNEYTMFQQLQTNTHHLPRHWLLLQVHHLSYSTDYQLVMTDIAIAVEAMAVSWWVVPWNMLVFHRSMFTRGYFIRRKDAAHSQFRVGKHRNFLRCHRL